MADEVETAQAAVAPPAPPPVLVPAFSFRDRLAAIAHGVEHAANVLYHDALAIDATVTNWTRDNPNLGPLINTGLMVAEQAIERTGFPVEEVHLVAVDIIAALRGMAALDNSVVGATVPGRQGSPT